MTDHSSTAPGAVLLDADGTLVDSTYLHVLAWAEAFAQAGHPVDHWRIHRSIGMGSSQLLAELLGDLADELGDEVKETHTAAYADLSEGLRRFDKVPELIEALHRRGVNVVLSTSAAPAELERIRDVLDVEDELRGITAAEDVEDAKPAPDLVTSGLDRAGVPAERAVFVGDAVWDVKASAAAGVTCVGVRTGGVSEAELREAGAAAVYESVAHLLAELDTSPLAATWEH